MLINNEQSLKTTLAFADKLGAVVSVSAYSFFIYHIKVKVDFEATK